MSPRRRSAARKLFRQRVRAALQRADAEFRGQYAEEIIGLLGLSKKQIDAITPDTTDIEMYNKLMIVVKEASRVNLEQAELVNRVRSLGEVAVAIAKKVPSLAAMLA